MTTYAGPPVFPQYFVDPLGKPLRSVKITVYERGTDVKPDLFADREKSTPIGNPFWATSLGNAEFRVGALGEFEAEANGVRIPFTVVADPEEPIPAGAVEEAMLSFGVATQVELDAQAAATAVALTAGLATKAPSTGIAQSAVTGLVSDLAGKQATIPPGTLVQVAGDTMTGPLVLAGAPASDLEAATKAYVDAVAIGNIDGGSFSDPGPGSFDGGSF
jgi:hypothetical protein